MRSRSEGISHAPVNKYHSEQVIAELTEYCVSQGERLLQIFRLASSEEEHALLLAQEMQLSPGETIIDAGCGTGALAGYLLRIEPTLSIRLLNIGAAQLAYADDTFEKKVGDIEQMPYDDASADGLIFSYVLGHVDLKRALAEAWRVLRPGGWLFIYDIVATGELHPASSCLQYTISATGELIATAEAAGFRVTSERAPPVRFVSNVVRASLAADEFDRVFQNVMPFVARFERALPSESIAEAGGPQPRLKGVDA